MRGHCLVDPVARTPASGREKGQVENRVGALRRRFLVPRPKFESCAEPNAWLEDRCIAHAKANKHPDIPDKTVREVFQAERPSLIPHVGPFDHRPAGDAAEEDLPSIRLGQGRTSDHIR